MTISNSHHYVPQWYQRNFLPAEGGEFFVLDKSPKLGVICPDGARRPIVRPRQVFTSGAHKLFQYDGLYSVALRGVREDVLERFVFGPLDDKGARANQLFCIWPTSRGIGHHGDYPESFGNPGHRMHDLVEFMNAQTARTPRGIAQIKLDLARRGQIGAHNNVIMRYLQQRRFQNCTVWAEGVWEIFSARNSAIKFILSDDPVVIYNCDCYPETDMCRFPKTPHPFWRGSRVIYPLSPEAVLVISHVEHADDPSRTKARRDRRNARSNDDVLINFSDIQNYREFDEIAVSKINYVIKIRSVRYIASIHESHLFPERLVNMPRWCDIDQLFYSEHGSSRGSTEMMVSYRDGTILHSNAFGERDVVPGWFVRQQEARRAAAAADHKKE